MRAKRSEQPAGNPLINNDRLKQLYASMLRCRMLAEKASHLRRGKHVGGLTLSVKQEAAAVGVVSHLLAGDALATAEGDLIPSFLKGTSLDAIISLLSNPPAEAHTSMNGDADLSLGLIPMVRDFQTRLNIATGTALAYKMQNNARVVTAFFTGETESLPGWQQTLKFADDHDLPIVYVILRDLSAEALPTEHAPDTFASLSFPVIPVDGHDVVAVYRVAQESILRARLGSGPTLIEAKTYRSNRRTIDAGRNPGTASPETNDPIQNMEVYLTMKGLFSEAWKRQIMEKFGRELEATLLAAGKPARSGRKRLASAS
jgi:TPP-dependent pyruvate/acetoin dehydrogenase alpha subunit